MTARRFGSALFALLLLLPTSSKAQEETTIWSGVFTAEQAERGKAIHLGVCAKCHGERGDGAGEPDQPQAPAIARATFLRNWEGQSLAGLFDYVRNTMPPDNPGSRPDQAYIDAIAYMLALTKAPSGTMELPPDPDALELIVVAPAPE